MTTDHTDTTTTCTCRGDRVLDELRDLIAAGWDQREASRLLWGDPTTAELAGLQARRAVRAAFTAAFPWLRLPPLTGSEVR